MLLKEIKDELQADVLVGQDQMDLEVTLACGADLMSDVLAFAKADSLLLTGLTHPQVIRTAEVATIRAICFVRGKRPPAETVERAQERGIPVLCTAMPMFESCGRLYARGLAGCAESAEKG